ncbi:MAG: hypothetical protein ACKOBW_04920 [Planctomycetota bacterium]
MIRRLGWSYCLALIALTSSLVAGAAWAQQGAAGGRGGAGGFGTGPGGFGTNRLMLLQIEAVQKELKLTPEQIAALEKLRQELRPQRQGGAGAPGALGGQRGPGAPGAPGRRGDQRPGGAPAAPGRTDDVRLEVGRVNQFLIQNQPEPPAGGARRGNLTPEQMQQFRQQMEERAKREREKLAEILKPDQLKRLNEIVIQVQGTGALSDPEVAKQLELTEMQKEEITKVRREAMESNREEMRALIQGQDREAARKKMAEVRKATDDKVLAVLTASQRQKFESLKGAPFAMPEGALRQGPVGGSRTNNNSNN